MKTIKIQVKRTVLEEKEIHVEFPLYTKREDAFYKALSDKKAVRVISSSYWAEISTSSLDFALGEGYQLITEAEFNEVFEKALNELKNL